MLPRIDYSDIAACPARKKFSIITFSWHGRTRITSCTCRINVNPFRAQYSMQVVKVNGCGNFEPSALLELRLKYLETTGVTRFPGYFVPCK